MLAAQRADRATHTPRAGRYTAGVPPAVLLDDDLTRDAAALAHAFGDAGLGAGDVLAVLLPGGREFVAARDAATLAGLYLLPIHPGLTAPEVAYLLRDSAAPLLLCHPSLAGTAALALAELARAPACFELGPGAGQQFAPLPRTTRVTEDALPELTRRIGSTIGATLIYTSGTTGRPKGCLRSAAQEAARAAELVATYGIGPDDVHLIACPLAHSAPGILLRAARARGARTFLLPRFDARTFLDAVERHRATMFFLVPTQYERLLALPAEELARRDLSTVRVALVAGAPLAPATRQRIVDWLGPGVLWEFYGSSETGTISVLPPAEQLRRPRSVGRPVAGVELQVRDEHGQCLGPGAVGEIFVRSPTVMSGYLGQPPVAGDFLSVGDLGYLDEDGFLHLVDRKHDTIISGGVNVYPAEVERAIAEHPAVARAVAFGVTDPQWGQIVAAAVCLRPAARLGAGELRAFLRQHLAPFKLPRAIAFLAAEELPVGGSGKPLRRRAAALLADSPRLVRCDRT
jgi:long-chain acyl-CoA synthetase